jgi:MoaA/NifB/PqqE/SkfB family radical SAM enzyme
MASDPERSETNPPIPLADLDEPQRAAALARCVRDGRPHVFPDHLIILLTNRCPLSCRGCSSPEWARTNHNRELPLDDWIAVVEQARELGARRLLISGGEPLLRARDALALVESASSSGMRTALMTSGHGLDPALLGELHAAGLNEISTSLDGATPAVHDAWRGADGNHAQVLALLGWSRDLRDRSREVPSGLDEWTANVTTVIAGHDAAELAEIHRVAVAAGADRHNFQVLSADDRFERLKVPESALEALSSQIDELVELVEAGAPITDPVPLLRQVVPYFASRGTTANPFACPALYSVLILAPDGAVSSCHEAITRTARIRDAAGELDLLGLWRSTELQEARQRMAVCEQPCLQRCWTEGG